MRVYYNAHKAPCSLVTVTSHWPNLLALVIMILYVWRPTQLTDTTFVVEFIFNPILVYYFRQRKACIQAQTYS